MSTAGETVTKKTIEINGTEYDKSEIVLYRYDWRHVPIAAKFAKSEARITALMGPFGCLRGDQLVITERGLLPISDITSSMRVLSWNERKNQFQLSLSGGAFPKGTDCLYQVTTTHGKFVSSGHHRVFCVGNKYQSVENLEVGDTLNVGSRDQIQKFSSGDLRSLFVDAPSYGQTVVDSLVRYAELARQYGQQLLQEANIYPAFVPLRDDVPELTSYSYSSASVQLDDWQARSQGHIHPYKFDDQTQTCDSAGRVVPRNEGAQGHISLLFSSRILESIQQFLRSQRKKVFRHIKKLFPWCFHSYPSSLSEGYIISIERLNVKEAFWDMQVLDTNNYVTADGTIHHNSGKSTACLMKILRRAHMQAPSQDGIRRSRWAIVRNTNKQLKDTTIRTVHQWLPPSIWGDWHTTDQNYTITGIKGIQLELMFRGLDREDQVSNLLSLELTGAWLNEAREIPKAIFTAMDGRIGRYPAELEGGCTWDGIIMDTNPPDEDNWFYKLFEIEKPEGYELYRQPSGRSPFAENTKNLKKNYYKNFSIGKDPMFVHVYIDGEYGFTVEGRPVWASFKDSIHVAKFNLVPIKGRALIFGFDFGLTPCCLIGQVAPNGQLRILDEMLSSDMGLRQFCKNILTPHLRDHYFGYKCFGYGDPSGRKRSDTDESTCYDILHSSEVGLYDIEPAPTNDLIPRIGAVEDFFGKMVMGEPGIVISPNCVHLRKALNGAYHYKKSTDKNPSNEPEKNAYSHIADALQMLCMAVTPWQEYEKKRLDFGRMFAESQTHYRGDAVAGY